MLIVLGLAAGGFGAGVFGALLGLGGGLLIVPLLTFVFGLPFREAVGVSLVCVIVTSSAGAGVYLQRHVANLRLGMLLEIFTATGALAGGLAAFVLSDRILAALFTLLLVYTAISMLRRREPAGPAEAASNGTAVPPAGPMAAADGDAEASAEAVRPAVPAAPTATAASASTVASAAAAAPFTPAAAPFTPAAAPLRVDPFRARLGGPGYQPHRLGLGVAGGFVAGVVSALLGVGGGIVKVPLMHLGMGVPMKVATATSNMMIGVTASASTIVYLLRGGIDPLVAGPTAVGVFAGALVGTRVARRIEVRFLRLVFVAVLAVTAVQMLLRVLG